MTLRSSNLLLIIAVPVMMAFQVLGQVTFQNLDFESARNLPDVTTLPPGQTAFVPVADAIPGWTAYTGTDQAGGVWYNGISAGGALVSLITTNTAKFSDLVIGGAYTATLFARINPNPGGPPLVPTAIAQTGLVPLGTRSLRFSVGSLNPVIYLKVTLDGQDISLFPLMAGGKLYGLWWRYFRVCGLDSGTAVYRDP